ncbi:hypothetical protein AA0119_g8731 [Alternaria tenuissima]|uniref:Rhodopsin domain-containing protein n=1 Tax=Alternaria tenuissima TaxID=119927 RepID=A0ABY0G497_9PLEO|nr:uncharacterized protein J4E82_008371 [Alternaria postmessia]KAH6862885.1 hypothetical protein B0T12DRAFT_105005 [Alternaria alternata]KAI5372968.1 hypothetical protein J4E82_008371 [Alternaria postmessia]RYN82950.1 hypothetical protein AA0120_g9322 [Alternaria tenuissima]RYN95417.1 hypothetical protein AA0119_g8731 [Alternaria tenuissima]
MIFSAYEGQQKDLQWVTVTLTVISTVLLIWRITNTIISRGWLGLEDVFVIMANIWLVLLAAFIYRSTTYGFGTRLVDIARDGGNATEALKSFWLTQSFYTLTNGFNKMAFLALYYRVFALKRFRQACIVLGVISVGWTVSYVVVCIFQCTPVPRVYNRTIPGTCINFFWHRWSNAILNLLTDLAIFILPMPVIFGLNMSKGSRIGLMVLFSMGFFICLTTALRMSTLPLSLRTREPTWQSAPTNLWSFIEAATGVITACLLSLRKSIGGLWPKRWRSNKGTSGAYQHYSGSNGIGLGISRPRTGNAHQDAFAMGAMRSGARGKVETLGDISPSESQERIIEDSKPGVHITSQPRRSNSTKSEHLVLRGITVTHDVEVRRN